MLAIGEGKRLGKKETEVGTHFIASEKKPYTLNDFDDTQPGSCPSTNTETIVVVTFLLLGCFPGYCYKSTRRTTATLS